uniref:Si:dkey-156n14.3 n=1 Tax=Cyprinodon variegatus TaxID=28743 RepID=A0A3Q2FSU5_CYPVA
MDAEKENVFGALLGSQDLSRTEWRFEDSGEGMQMALFDGEAEAPGSRQQREADGEPGRKADRRPQEQFAALKGDRAEAGGSGSRAPAEGGGDSLCCAGPQTLKRADLSLVSEDPDRHTVEDVVLTNKYGDKICGQICTENGEESRAEPEAALIPREAMEAAGAEDSGPPAGDTFSGTITINNQSIIVTIENGVLTLAAPPEGTLAAASQQQEPRPDSELAPLEEDCSLPQLGPSLDSCSVVKQEAGELCAVTEADLIAPSPRAPSGGCNSEESLQLIRSRKDAAATFTCPEPGCSSAFDSRQKLKVHLLNHTEEPRPYQCSVEGCGWAFATSYKLKRHIQSHDKQRPHTCEFEGCGRRFTTVYNLKAHVKVHEQENAFICEVCSEKFRSATRLTNHQRVHFAPQRPHKCEYPGCEKTFITFSALFSHNRTHFRETGQFSCTYPGCNKTYDKACRLKIHMRSHTGKLLEAVSAAGPQQTPRMNSLHGGKWVLTFQLCSAVDSDLNVCFLSSGCYAKFSARSSLYIHSKKHKQDASSLRTRCPVANCSKHFSSRSSLKSHMLKHHHLSPDVLSQMETTPSLTPSSELISAGPDHGSSGAFTMDLSLVSSGILTIDPSSMGATLVSGTTLAKPLDPLVLAPGAELTHQHGLEGAVGDVLPPQGTLNLDDVQTVTPEALGTLAALTMQGASVDPALQHPLGSSSGLAVEPSAALAVAPVPELLASPSKVLGPQDGGKVLTSQFVFPSSSFSPQKDLELSVSPSSFLVRTSPPLWAPLSWPSIPEATSAIYPKLAIDGESDTASIFGRSGEDSGLVLFSLESLNLERCRSLKLSAVFLLSRPKANGSVCHGFLFRTAAVLLGPTTEPSSWPRRRSREVPQPRLVLSAAIADPERKTATAVMTFHLLV